MKALTIRIIKLMMGLFLFAVGIVMTINANVGLSPWDVFHQGLSKMLNITLGQAGIAVGFIIILINFFFKEKIGWGTVGNMLFIGLYIDFLMFNHLVPTFESVIPSTIMMFLGLFVVGCASYCYISSGFGSGPRDGLMVVLTKRTNKSVRFVRNTIEISVAVAGWLLGGFVGVGTVVMAVTTGYFVQFAFKLFKFDVKAVEHRYIDDDIRFLYQKFRKEDEGLEEN